MKSYTIQQYLNAGCPEMSIPIMVAVHGKTGGKVCDTGCHAFHNGKCPAYKKLTSTPFAVKAPRYKDSNKEFARNNTAFKNACALVVTNQTLDTLKPSPRQASKFRNGKGLAFKALLSQKNKKADQLQP